MDNKSLTFKPIPEPKKNEYLEENGTKYYLILFIAPVFLQALHLPVLIPAADGFPFIVFFLALGQTDCHLDMPILEIELERDQGKAFFFGFADQAPDFPPVQEEFTGAGGVGGIGGGKGVGADVGVVQIDLAFLNPGKAIVNIGLSQADRFNFGAGEDDAGFDHIVDKIIEVGFAILTDDFHCVVFHVKNAVSNQLRPSSIQNTSL